MKFTAISRSRLTTWTLAVDGAPAIRRAQRYPRGITIDTRTLPDGWHALRAEIHDFPGNVGALDWSIRVDNTRPTLVLRRVIVRRPGDLPAGAPPGGARCACWWPRAIRGRPASSGPR